VEATSLDFALGEEADGLDAAQRQYIEPRNMIRGEKPRPLWRRDLLRENTQSQQPGERPAEGDLEPQPQLPTAAQREPLQGCEGQKQEQGKNDGRHAEISHASPRGSIVIRASLRRLAYSLMTAR
jgi:hypothetical protein